MVVRSVAPFWPPVTRLPTSMRLSEMRPSIGARTSLHSRFSWAVRWLASAASCWARAMARLARRWSTSRAVIVWLRTSPSARSTSFSVSCTCALVRATSACAASTASLKGLGSMVNSTSPRFTIWPSRKCTLSR